MSKYKLDWVEKKNIDWVVVSIEGDGQPKEVSINRKSKTGELFPNFDGIQPGAEVEGELWQSNAGKWYLFPPKPITTPSGAPRGSGGAFKAQQIDKHETRKEGFIEKIVHTKEESIKMAGAQRDAVLIVVELLRSYPPTEFPGQDFVKSEIIKWRDWFLSDEFQATLPFSTDGTK